MQPTVRKAIKSRQVRRRLRLKTCSVLLAALAALPAWSRCLDEDQFDTTEEPAAATAARAHAAIDPRVTLRTLVNDAIERSHLVGAAKLAAEAAQDDLAEIKAGKGIQASFGAGLGPGGTQSLAGTETSAMQARASITAGQLLYDGGRLDRLADWRAQMGESARLGHLSVREQLALSTVSLAIERSRYRQQVLVYRQYVRKMACLMDALTTIVRADRGRASELVQSQKSFQQAELSLAQAQSQLRQAETRLRRLAGDGLPSVDGLSSVLLNVPDLTQLVGEVERSSDIAALSAQAAALDQYAQAVAAGTKPQLSWSVTGSQAVGGGGSRGTTRNGTFAVGLALNLPLLNPGVAPASSAARKRARAADLQKAEALEAKRFRVAEVHEQTMASFDRARRLVAVLRDSEQVRNFTMQQWQQMGRRSLFDVMGAESDHYNMRVNYVNALHDGQQFNANLVSLGLGLNEWLR